jgi:regulator of sirC expression with transglutaminase-like and TPR domain
LRALLGHDPIELDRIMATIASVAADPPREDDIVAALDRLAAGLRPPPADDTSQKADAVIAYTFGELGFVGNTTNYYSPANSLIHRVLKYRRGIPLTLAAVAVEIGRRHGVELSIVGLPGHVVIGDGPEPVRWFDPFAAGAILDLGGCRRLFGQFQTPEAFDEAMVAPIDGAAVATRMVANLKLAYRRLGDLGQLASVLELAVAIPGSAPSDRLELAAVLAALGRNDQAATQRDLLATLDPSRAAEHRLAAFRHRARHN